MHFLALLKREVAGWLFFFTALCAHHCIINQGTITSRPGPAGGNHSGLMPTQTTWQGRSEEKAQGRFLSPDWFLFRSLLFLFVLSPFFIFLQQVFRLCECASEIKLVWLIQNEDQTELSRSLRSDETPWNNRVIRRQRDRGGGSRSVGLIPTGIKIFTVGTGSRATALGGFYTHRLPPCFSFAF